MALSMTSFIICDVISRAHVMQKMIIHTHGQHRFDIRCEVGRQWSDCETPIVLDLNYGILNG